MKNKLLLFLAFISFIGYSQNPTRFPAGIQITGGQSETTDSNKILSQSATGLLNTINAFNLPAPYKSKFKNPIDCRGKEIHWFGDSYTAKIGASNVDKGFTAIVSRALGAIEVNHGVAGTTMEKRVPIDYMASPNMVDNVVNIPVKTTSMSMLAFGFNLNDMGNTATAYNVANYKTDYQFVINSAVSKGWLPSQILIISGYYIGSAGYAAYATITGNPAPTQARHLAFNQAAKEISEANGTMYFDPYPDQQKNNTNLLDPDGIHANDLGHAYLAYDLLQALGYDKSDITTNSTWDLLPGYVPIIYKGNMFKNSLIYDDGTRVGLGTITPQAGFHLNSVVSSVKQKMSNSFTGQTATDGVDFEIDGSGNFTLKNFENGDIYIYTNNTKRATVLANGRILVNTNTDNGIDQFQVNGPGMFSGTTNTPLSGRSTAQSYIKSISGGTSFDAAFYSFDGTNAVAMGLLASSGITPGNFGVFANGAAQMDVGFGGFKIPTLTGSNTVKATIDASGKLGRGSSEPLTYVALVSQTSTSAPVVTVQVNTLGVTPTVTRTSAGIYNVNVTGSLFSTNKTTATLSVGSNAGATGVVNTRAYWLDTGNVRFSSYDGTTLTDGMLSQAVLEINVYP